MARLGEYTFLVTDLLSGNILDSVELNSFYWNEIYNSPGAALATARIDKPTTTSENFNDWANALWVIEDGVIQWGGIIGKTQRKGGTRVLSVPVLGFFEYYRNRLLRDITGMAYGSIENISDIVWRNVDQFHIFQDYIEHAHSFTDGDIGIGVTWDALSEQLITSIRRTFTVKRIGIAIEEILDRITGFSYRQVYSWVNGKPHCDFKLEYPHHSLTVATPLIFQPERISTVTTTLLRAMEVNATGDFASAGDVTSITGDLDIEFSAEGYDWTPASDQVLRSKWGSAGNRSYKFSLLTTGMLRLEWSENGTNILSDDSDSATGFTDNTVGTVRVYIDVDNGSGDYVVTFFKSTDGGATWVSLSTDPYESNYGATY